MYIDEFTPCAICGGRASAYHHIIYRSQNRALIKCTLNLAPLCDKCHRTIHSKNGAELDKELKLYLQNEIELLFLKEYIKEKEIRDTLKINENASRSLLKTLKVYKEGYKREDVIRAIMGGRFYATEWNNK